MKNRRLAGYIKDGVFLLLKKGVPKKTVQYLMAHNLTVATAESCTAGLICASIGNMPGVSCILEQGFITYSNEAKESLLGVPRETLAAHGAVSKETAQAMAEGVCQKTGAKVGISATGIAGPGGGTKEKPVGLVYVGICVNSKTSVCQLKLTGNRKRVRRLTVLHAFDALGKQLKKTQNFRK